MQELSEINGTVAAVIFRNDENGYGVVKLELDNGETTTAVGCLPYVAPGEMISAEGSWMTHAQHGRQFKIEQCSRSLSELEEQQNSRADLNAHIAEIRRVLQAARDDAVNGLINRDFVQKYIDRIFVTVDNDKIQLQIKLFTSESTMRYLEKLERRSGHTFKKMIESYEQNMANQG